MKIDRLIAILVVLLQKEKVTAPYLAEKFEVSRRTINRDIDAICQAGIPILTTQGAQGGISIQKGYKIDSMMLNDEELRAVFSGLSSLNSVANDTKYQTIIDKFLLTSTHAFHTNHMLIDLSSHYKDTLAPKIARIREAISSTRQISFTYYNDNGDQHVFLNPYLIVFQWTGWYVFGCKNTADDFRLYKLNRLWNLQINDTIFILHDIPKDALAFHRYFTDETQVKVLFDADMKYKLIDEYGPSCFTVCADGKLLFAFGFTNKEYFLSWILSFGDHAELLSPLNWRDELQERIQMLMRKYYNHDI